MRHTTLGKNLLTLLGGVLGAFAVVAGVHVISAFAAAADGDSSTEHLDRVVPYRGTLKYDGALFTGDVEVRVGLYSDASCATNVWLEERSASTGHGTVEVTGGEFTVLLGQYTALTDDLIEEPVLYVKSAYRLPGTTTYSWLGCNLLTRNPYAVWTAAADDFAVTRALTLGEGLDVAGTLTVTGAVRLTSSSSQVRFGLGADGSGPTSGVTGLSWGDGNGLEGIQLTYDLADHALVFEKGYQFFDGTDLLRVDMDDFQTSFLGNLTVGGLTYQTDTSLGGGDLEIQSGHRVYINGSKKGIIFEDTTAGQRGIAFGDGSTSQGAQWLYYTDTNELKLENQFDFDGGDDLIVMDYDTEDVTFPNAVYLNGDLETGYFTVTSSKGSRATARTRSSGRTRAARTGPSRSGRTTATRRRRSACA